MSLRVRRGLEADRTSETPDDGEFLYDIDAKTLYIGDGSTPGGNPVGGMSLPWIILKSPNGNKWKFTVGDDGMLSQPGENLGP